MKIVKILTTIVIVASLLLLTSCDVKKEAKKPLNLQALLDSTTIDLSLIPIKLHQATEIEKKIAYFQGTMDEKIVFVKNLLKENPKSEYLINHRLSLFDKQKNSIRSKEGAAKLGVLKRIFVDRIIKKDSTTTFNKYLLSSVENNPEKIKEYAISILNNDRNSVYGFLSLAEYYVKARKFDKLEEIATIYYLALKNNPTNENAYLGLSSLFNYMDKTEEKATLDGVYFQINTMSIAALDGLIYYYISKNNIEKAKETVVIFDKNNKDLLKNSRKSNYYLDMKEFKLAQKEIEIAKQNKENSTDYYFAAAMINSINNKIDSAVENLEYYADIDKNNQYLNYVINTAIFNEKLYKSKKYIALLKKIEPKTPVVGEKMPTIKGLYSNKSKFKMKDLRKKVVLLDFWASWCTPCKQEMPNVIKVYNKYHDKGFTVLGINLDKKIEDCNAYLTTNKIQWKHIFSGKVWKDENVSKYGVKGIPATFLIDKKGIIRFKYIRGEENLSKYVKMLLK